MSLNNNRKNSLSLIALAFGMLSFFISCSCRQEIQSVTSSSTTLKVEQKIHQNPKVDDKKLNPSDFVESVKSRKLFDFLNSKPTDPYAYYWESSVSYGGGSSSTNLPLFRWKGYFEANVKEGTRIVDGKVETFLKVISPSVNAFRLEAVSKVIVEVDGKQYVFDTDEVDLSKSLANNPNKQVVVEGISDNPRSINSTFFKETLKKARKVSFGVRDAYWSDYSGNKTKYKLSPKDIVFSFIRTFLLTPGERHKYGGSKKLDETWYSKTKADRFLETKNWPNEYLLEVFGVDDRAFLRLDEEFAHKPLETLEVEGASIPVFSVYLKEEASTGALYDFFQKNLLESQLFLLAPSEYLEEQHKLRTNFDEGSGLVHRVGYYWYGQREEDMLFAAPYMPFEHTLEGQYEVKKVRKNPNYWDQKWVKNPNNIREVITTSLKQDAASYSQSSYSNFVQGISILLEFDNLTPEVNKKIREGSDLNIPVDLIKVTTKINKASIPWSAVFNAAPKHSVDEKGNVDTSLYAFNDAYSQFMYGASLQELAKGEVQTLKTFFGDDQIAFRSLLVAGVNWHRAVLDITEGNNIYSLTLAAPDARIEGSDQESSKYKTIAEAYSLANSPFVVWEGKQSLVIPIEENVKGAASHKRSESYMGGGPKIYAQLQEKMTKLLDKVFAKHKFSEGTTFEVNLYWYTFETKDVWNQAWEAILEALNNLDKKGRLKFARKQFLDRKEFDSKKEFLARSFQGWSYDFEGNGSYVDSVFFRDFYVPFLYKLLDKDEKDLNNPFPMLTRLAKLFAKGIKEEKYRFKVPFEKWIDVRNKDSWKGSSWLEAKGFPNPASEFTLFFFNSQRRFTNEEAIKLNVELAVLGGPTFDVKANVQNPDKAFTYLSHKGVVRPSYFVDHSALRILDTTYLPLSGEEEEAEDKKTE